MTLETIALLGGSANVTLPSWSPDQDGLPSIAATKASYTMTRDVIEAAQRRLPDYAA